mgnify:CR=1 FL=1
MPAWLKDKLFLKTTLRRELAALGKMRTAELPPIILVMLLLGALIVLSQGSAVAPFIYTLF